MHNKQILQGIIAAILLAFVGLASAGTATANLNVSASVAANCTIGTASVAFGTYDPIVAHATSPLDATGAVTITCTKGTATTITLGLGATPAGSTRQMTGTGGLLAYELYQQPGTTPGTACNYTTPTIWGTTGAEIYTPTAAPSKVARTYNVCGRVPAGQDVGSGSYTDTVVATVNF
jgi:spore coat protein U-like protein